MGSVRDFEVLVDGRILSCLEAGVTGGIPVFVFGGTPGSKLIKPSTIEDAEIKGLKLISYSRPGYGDSTRQPGRSVASVAVDVKAIAEELGLRKILVWGISGGGPHTIACTSLLPEMVVAAVSLASPAPFDAEDLDWFTGMGEDNIIEFNAAIESHESIKKFVEDAIPGMLNANPEDMVKSLQTLLCPVDASVMDIELASFFADSNKEGIGKNSSGWIDDDIAFTTSWNFEFSSIQVPLLLMHGEQDLMVPCSHGKWLAGKINNAESIFFAEDGHLSLGKKIPEVHDWLLSKWAE